MKVKLISSILVLYSSVLFGCATTSDIKPYTVQPQLSASLQEGVVFSLPRTILEVKITYSLYDKKVWPADAHGNPIKKDKDGKLLSPKTTARIVAIYVFAGTMISSPSCIAPSSIYALKIKRNASKPLATPTQFLVPV